MPSSDPEPELFGAATVESTVATTSTDPRHRVLALAGGLVVVALLVWLLARSPDGDDVSDDPADPASTTSTATPRTTAVRALPPPTTLFVPEEVDPDGPAGLWLFYGGADGLQRLDLDTGVVDRYGVRAHPVLTVGDQLVLATDGGEIGWVDLADPGGQAGGWSRAKLAPGGEPGALWLQRLDEGAAWIGLEPSTGTVLERNRRVDGDVLETGLAGRTGVIVPGPELVDTANGIYRVEGDGTSVRVGSGRILTYDTTRVLVERCGDRLDDCALAWHDRTTWAPLDLPAPAVPGLRYAEIVGGGRWLDLIGADRRLLVDLTPNDDGADSVALNQRDRVLAVSPDGRWLAVLGTERTEVISLDTGASVLSVELERERGGTLLLVDKAAAAG